MARIFFLLFFTIILFLTGCNNSTCYTKLEEVDSLTEKYLTDSACKMIKEIEKTYNIKEGKEKAYYNLLKYQLQFRIKYKNKDYPIDNNLIDYSISYYSKYTDNRKLGLCYYLKGRMSRSKDAIKYFKEAEFAALKTNDNFLKMRIYNNIAAINVEYEDYTTALKNAQKAIEYGKKTDQYETLIWCYLNLVNIYGNLEDKDNSRLNAKKTLAYLDKASIEQKLSIYINTASAILETDPAKSREYALESIKIEPTHNAYMILAKLARDRKEYKLSEVYLDEAMKYCPNADWEATILYEMAQTKKLMGKHEEANILNERAIALNDSIEDIMKQDSIKEIQVAAEMNNNNQKEIEAKDNRTIIITAVLTLIIVVIAAVYGRKIRRHKKSMGDMELQMEDYQHEIAEIKEENKKKEKEIEAVNKEIEAVNRKMERQKQKMMIEIRNQTMKVRQEERDSFRKGYDIYNKVKNGTETIKWDKTNIENLTNFYQNVKPDFNRKAGNKDKRLTGYQHLLLIIKDMGLSNRHTAQILGVSDNAIRTQMSRIKRTSPSEKDNGTTEKEE